MPIDPPAIPAPSRFEPSFITQQDLEDLASYTGMSPEECLARVRSYSLEELAQAWKTKGPTTPEEVVGFYRSTDLYIWELMQWHASAARQPYWAALSFLLENYPPEAGWRRVYDFGCGVGTDALFLASHGYDVTLVDVDGPTFRFAKHRFERRNLSARFIASTSPLPAPDAEYDVAVCFDVFEHLPDPLAAARQLVATVRERGLLVQQGGFADEGYHPCHLREGLSRYGGARWHICLAGLGLRRVTGLVYSKATGFEYVVQRLRYSLWRVTGLWLSTVAML